MITSVRILWMIVCVVFFDAVAAPRPDDAVIFCTNTGAPVQMRWRVPNPDTSGTVVIVAPSGSEVLECQGGSVSVAPAYRERVQGATTANGQIQLALTRVTSKDKGVYECREGSAQGRTLDNCRQQLCYIEINKPNIHKEGFELEGQCVMLSCIGIVPYSEWDLGLRYAFEWFKDGMILPEQRGQHLTINNMTQSDKGAYTCRITEVEKTCATSADSPMFQLHMFMTPSLSIKVSNGTAEVTALALNLTIDDNVTLICEVKLASPPVGHYSYRWTLTRPGSEDRQPFMETTNRLELGSLSTQSSGLYTCLAYNDDGAFKGRIPPGQTSINISVFYLTNMVLTTHPDRELKEGESFSISCKVASSPVASLTWYKDGEKRRHIQHNTDNYAVLKANRSHSGNYSCQATHVDPRIPPLQQSVNILVLFEPFVRITAKADQKDLSIPENQTLSVSQNHSLTLTCVVESPLPLNHSHFFNWTFSPEDSTEGQQHKEGDTLTFNPVTKDHSGRYTCQAWSTTEHSCQMLDKNATVKVNVIAEEGSTSDSKMELTALTALIAIPVVLAIVVAAVLCIRKRRASLCCRAQVKGNSRDGQELKTCHPKEETKDAESIASSHTPMLKGASSR